MRKLKGISPNFSHLEQFLSDAKPPPSAFIFTEGASVFLITVIAFFLIVLYSLGQIMTHAQLRFQWPMKTKPSN